MLKVCRFRCFRPCSKRRDGKSRDAYTCSAKLLCKLPLEAILLESYLKYTPLSKVNRLPPATKSLHSTPPPPTPVRFKKTHGSSSNIILTVRSCVFCNIVTGRPPKPDETPILMHAYPRGLRYLTGRLSLRLHSKYNLLRLKRYAPAMFYLSRLCSALF